MTEVQTDLFGSHVYFDGQTYSHDEDQGRLSGQLDRVKRLMLDGEWRTLACIHRIVGGTEAAVSARLRDLRKERFGSYTVQRRACGARNRGLFEYRVLPQETPPHDQPSGQEGTDLSHNVAGEREEIPT